MESRYLGILRRLQEIKSLDPAQREAVQKMIENALKGEQKSITKLSVNRYKHLSLSSVNVRNNQKQETPNRFSYESNKQNFQ